MNKEHDSDVVVILKVRLNLNKRSDIRLCLRVPSVGSVE